MAGMQVFAHAALASAALQDKTNILPRQKPKRGQWKEICHDGDKGKDGRPHGSYNDYFTADLIEAVKTRLSTAHLPKRHADHPSLKDLEMKHCVPAESIRRFEQKATNNHMA